MTAPKYLAPHLTIEDPMGQPEAVKHTSIHAAVGWATSAYLESGTVPLCIKLDLRPVLIDLTAMVQERVSENEADRQHDIDNYDDYRRKAL